MLNAPWRFHVGANEFKHVGLLPIEYRVEQLMLGHMFNIINGNDQWRSQGGAGGANAPPHICVVPLLQQQKTLWQVALIVLCRSVPNKDYKSVTHFIFPNN